MSCKKGKHLLLVVDDFTSVGVLVECLSCGKAFHLNTQEIEDVYVPFQHTSPKGPDRDVTLLIHDSLLRGIC